MARHVFIVSRDLLFRSKLEGVVAARGGETTREESACDLAVVEIEIPGAEDRIRGFVARGIPVLAYGSHVRADLLAAARRAGATAVPNSQIERRLSELVRG